MDLNTHFDSGQTPLDVEDISGLIDKDIHTKEALNLAEQRNIQEAIFWLMTKPMNKQEVLTFEFLRLLHIKMFGKVWDWAGSFRKTEKNIGVAPHQISGYLKMLLDDVNYWMENKVFHSDEICIRFKHKIVSIHCFPNGNGRHSRLMADILSESIFNNGVFTWGKSYTNQDELRLAYLFAIRQADSGNFEPLIRFSRT